MRRLIAMLLLLPIHWQAYAQNIPAHQAFGAREGIEDVSLSPDGEKVSLIAPAKSGQGSQLFTIDLNAGGVPKSILAADGDPERLNWCEWVSNDRLMCSIYAASKDAGVAQGMSRLIAIDADGKNIKLLTRRQGQNAEYFANWGGGLVDLLPGQDGMVLLQQNYIKESATGTLAAQKEEGLGVDRVDTRTLASKRVVKPNRNAAYYISDGRGNVRIMTIALFESGYDSGRRRNFYRDPQGGEWKPLSEFNISTGVGFDPYYVDPTENVAYGLEKREGRWAIYKIKLDTSLAKTIVAARDDVDVSDFMVLGRERRVIGASFVTDKRFQILFDEELSKLQTALAKALPDAEQLSFQGMSEDGSKFIIYASSDTNPGQYYHFDRKSKSVSPLFPSRPELEGTKLATVKPVTSQASDGVNIPGYLTLPPGSNGKNLPAIVMPHGGPSARDEWGFDWLAQYFANRGFAVLQPNYRGSFGYGDDWYQNNGFQSWRLAIGDVNDSARWLVKQGIADPTKLSVVGWSYGGYAALQSAVLDPDLFKAIIAIAPVTDLEKLKDQYREYTNYRLSKDFIGSGPHILQGSPARHAEKFKAPVLMFHGDVDLNVNITQSRVMEDQLKAKGKSVELVVYKNRDHSLVDSVVRSEMLEKSDAFLRKALGLPAGHLH